MVSGWKKPDHGETQEKEEETYTGDPQDSGTCKENAGEWGNTFR